jgi:membrane protease subunit HflK
LVRYLAGNDLFSVLSTGRSKGAELMRQQIEQQADQQHLGVSIVYVGLEDLHPPVKVASEFENVVAAQQVNEARRQEAKGYASKVLAEAEAEAVQKINDSLSYSNSWVLAKRAEAGQFSNRLAAFHASPSVFMERTYLQTLIQATTNADKYVSTSTNNRDLYQYNLEQKLRNDLINDINIPPPRK